MIVVFVFATKKHQGRHSPRGLVLGRGGNGREGHCATGIDLARELRLDHLNRYVYQ